MMTKKIVAAICLLMVFSTVAFAQTQKTKEQWEARIKQDAKFSSLTALLGKPIYSASDGGMTRYYWGNALNDGTADGGQFGVVVDKYKGEQIVIGLVISGEAQFLPWARIVRPDL